METTTNLCAWGTSQAVRIPKKMCEEAGMETGEALTLTLRHDESGPFVVIRPAKSRHRSCGDAPYRSIDEIFAGYAGDWQPSEADWGAPVGAEILE